MVPWGLCGVFFTGALGVPTTEYFPFVYLALFVPIIAVIYAFTGRAIWYGDEKMSMNPKKREKASV
jgi:NhaC family Na+:H+ antiporter